MGRSVRSYTIDWPLIRLELYFTSRGYLWAAVAVKRNGFVD